MGVRTMSKKRTGLIIGNLALFAGIGCDAASSGSIDTGAEVDALSISDAAGPQDANNLDQSIENDASNTVDAALNRDRGRELDQSQRTDGEVALDRSIPNDIGTADEGTPSVDNGIGADVLSPVLDMNIVADAGGPDGICDRIEGQPCQENFRVGCCEEGQAFLICAQGQYAPVDNVGLVGCDCAMPDGITNLVCAVPGFVGISRSGYRRQNGINLRRYLLNS